MDLPDITKYTLAGRICAAVGSKALSGEPLGGEWQKEVYVDVDPKHGSINLGDRRFLLHGFVRSTEAGASYPFRGAGVSRVDRAEHNGWQNAGRSQDSGETRSI